MPFLNNNEKLSRVRLVPTSPGSIGSVDGEFWYDAASGTLLMNQAGTIVQIAPSSGGGAVSSVFGRTGAVTAQLADYQALIGFYTKVVDIGPHSNTGPGDQSKGILDWSASPIVLLLAPGVGKALHLVSFDIQYKAGVSYAGDTDGQSIGLGVGLFTMVSGTSASFNFLLGTADGHIPWGSIVSNFQSPQNASSVANSPAVFGDLAGPETELAAGTGTLRITVHYTIDDILT